MKSKMEATVTMGVVVALAWCLLQLLSVVALHYNFAGKNDAHDELLVNLKYIDTRIPLQLDDINPLAREIFGRGGKGGAIIEKIKFVLEEEGFSEKDAGSMAKSYVDPSNFRLVFIGKTNGLARLY